MQSVSQPPVAKIADTFGRLEAYSLCLFLYALGYIIVASANSIVVYCVGSSIYIPGGCHRPTSLRQTWLTLSSLMQASRACSCCR